MLDQLQACYQAELLEFICKNRVKVSYQQGQAVDNRLFLLTHCMLMDSSTVTYWTSPFVTLGVSGLFCHLYSIFEEKSC